MPRLPPLPPALREQALETNGKVLVDFIKAIAIPTPAQAHRLGAIGRTAANACVLE